jgi:hypothetical protein
MQLADAIPATLCRQSRRYDYCMRLFQPRDILDPLSTFFLLCLGYTLNRRRTNFAFSHFIVDVRHFELFFHKKMYESRRILKQVLKFFAKPSENLSHSV